ncbi:F-box/RNI-like superfamily protein [Rhynchospora pubera]|uniref:F-box/RNI-like superfamily protein n=1 Tax=Rhynchospora pubera TaxID=906938 RepID=A0AAV8GYE3_9POAL|nr:F-box/RNI-like superfamily protein [Rhynchospora pubera]
MKFITSFLLSIDKATKLDVFKLRCCLADNNLYEGIGNDMSYFACMWITLAVERKVKKLHLKMSYYDCLRIPDSLFVCDSLEELELSLDLADDDFVEVRPEKVNLPKLKRLRLSNIAIHEDYMKKIVNGCPVLECLDACCCSIVTRDVFFGGLKRLSVICCDFDCLDISRMVPGLEYLFLAGVTIDDISSNKMHKLTEARITCHGIEEGMECDVLGSLVNVEVLEFISISLMDVLEKALQKSLIFDKLRRLTLGDCCMNCAFGFLSSLLEHTPKLETLTLLHGFLLEECCKVNGDHGQNSREKIEWFRCKCLKKVEIFCTASDSVPELVERVKLSTLGLNEVLVVVSTR